MAEKFVTVERSSDDYQNYLNGSFDSAQLALPVRSLNLKPSRLLQTFRLVDRTTIKRPNLLVILASMVRWRWLGFAFGPMIVLLGFLLTFSLPVKIAELFLSATSLFFLFCSVFMIDDYYDHVGGRDILSTKSGSQVIQRGWLQPSTVFWLGWFCFLVAALLAIPLLQDYWDYILPFMAVGLASVVGFSFRGKGFKYQGWGDFWLFLGFGPILAAGLCFVVYIGHINEVITQSVVLGWLAVLAIQAHQFETLMYDEFSGNPTFIARLGFDLSQKFLQWSTYGAMILGCFIVFSTVDTWKQLVVLPVLFFGFFCVKKLTDVSSPLSSKLKGLSLWFTILHASFVLVFVLATYLASTPEIIP